MAQLTVRVIRTYHVHVSPEWGDTGADIAARACALVKATTKPDAESAVILDDRQVK